MNRTRKMQKEALIKCPTGIKGLDEITGGGLPKGRPTLVFGSAGCGKTLLGLEFLVRGILDYNEPGIFISFEEEEDELITNVNSLGWDLKNLVTRKKLYIDYIYIEPDQIQETGQYDLEGLLLRIEQGIKSINAKRIVLDTMETIFTGFTNESILRAEIRRLFHWLKKRGMTAVVTGELGESGLTRFGMEEYISDCVIFLDHRLSEQISTRRLRVLKYRGSFHGTNEYPFLIGEKGISVLPITSVGLNYKSSSERVSTGIARLDSLLGKKGYYRGTSILISGTAGMGKTSIAASFVNAACRRGERCLYFSFEESVLQIIRNMRSINIDLEPWIKKHILQCSSFRITSYSLEMLLMMMHKEIEEYNPKIVVIDPISNFMSISSAAESKNMLIRLVDYLKMKNITTLFTDLTHAGASLETSESDISSLMDTWILLRDIEISGERNRGIYILKSRGMAHSNQIREFIMTDNGIDLLPVYLGQGKVFTGSARVVQIAQDNEENTRRQEEIESMKRNLERKRVMMQAKVADIQAEFKSEEEEVQKLLNAAKLKEGVLKNDRKTMKQMRKAD